MLVLTEGRPHTPMIRRLVGVRLEDYRRHDRVARLCSVFAASW